jgi:hypothetical protein
MYKRQKLVEDKSKVRSVCVQIIALMFKCIHIILTTLDYIYEIVI